MIRYVEVESDLHRLAGVTTYQLADHLFAPVRFVAIDMLWTTFISWYIMA